MYTYEHTDRNGELWFIKACFKINKGKGNHASRLKKEKKKKVSGSFWILASKFIHMASDAQMMCVQKGGRTCTRYVQVILYRNTSGEKVKLIIKNNVRCNKIKDIYKGWFERATP